MDSFRQQLTACMQNDPPPCAAACPFRLDVRAFIGHLKRGAFGAAFRLYRDAVVFPGIVSRLCTHPCQGACVFAGQNGALSLRELEAAAIAYAPNPRPNRYNMPKRPGRIAVIGAGPSGLACALRLASKKYEVVLFEREERTGGSLRALLPEEILRDELDRQFMYEDVTFRLSEPVGSLDQIQADAVYVATGAGGDRFGLELSGQGACASGRRGVFLGGSLVGRDPMEAIADGLTAARAIERYLKTGEMNEPLPDGASRFHPDPALIPYTPPAERREGAAYTKEEAVAEAARCQQCQCDACVKYCDLMRSYRKYPKRLEEEVTTTIEPVSLSRNARVATRLIATCNHCGLCKQVCPASLDTGAYLLDSHRQMKERNAMPWAYHEFWLRDMAFSNGEASLLVNPGGGRPRCLFFPGCRLGGSDPEAVLSAYRFLRSRQPDTALYLSCCGAPADWAGEEALHAGVTGQLRAVWESLGRPTVLFACLSCRKQFRDDLPDVPGLSLYEWLDGFGPDIPRISQRTAVFDPCSSRDWPETQRAVRSLAQKAGLELESLPMEGKYAQCCGWGGQVELANPSYADGVARSRAAQSELPYLVYCANCRDVFAKREKPAAHILSALFSEQVRWSAPPPTASESRENRRRLVRELRREFDLEGGNPVEPPKTGAPLLIRPELLEKMDRLYLLREDVEAVVAHCEGTGQKLLDSEAGTFIGHMRVGNMTLWVVYRNLENCRELVNVYAHRMQIVEGSGNV